MRGLRLWLITAGLTLASLALAFVVVELGLRLFAPQPTGITHQDRYGLQLHYPGITRYLPSFGHDITFNSAGMRDVEHPIVKPPGVFRILLLGDSFMEAMQVTYEESLPSLLQRGLEARLGRPVEVINAGVSGWGTDDELRYLTEYGSAYSPDLVVVAMTLHNDVSDNLRQAWHRLDGDSLVSQPVEPVSFLRFKVVELKAYLATRFQSYQLWRRVRHGGQIRQAGQQLTSHVARLFELPSDPGIVRGVRLTALLLDSLDLAAARIGAPTVLVLLPIRYQLADSAFAEFARGSGLDPARMPLRRPQDLFLAIADSLQIPTIDLLPGYRRWTADSSEGLYLEWEGHWNAAGHRLAATLVEDGLVDAVGVIPAPAARPPAP